MKRPLIFLTIAAMALIISLSLWDQRPDMTRLRGMVGTLRDWRAAHPISAPAIFFATYITATTLSVPIATMLTLIAGAVFGFWTGLALVSFASATGATLAMLGARYLLRDFVRTRMGHIGQRIDQGIARDGWLYLLSLRLMPAMPFFAVNLGMGLSVIPTSVFYTISQIGMLPATANYVNAGTRLSQMNSLSDIVSPPIIASLAALALLPWVIRLIAQRIKGTQSR